MTQAQSGSEAAAALVGSLATFTLIDVLDLLARTGHTGELQVVGRGVDNRLWVDAGELLQANTDTANAALFELACIEEGWFYFTASTNMPEGRTRVPVTNVLEELGPQVTEWRELVTVLPADAMVKMSSKTPGGQVQIRADQWTLLSLVGSPGRTVREVIDECAQHPLDTLRTLRELADAKLIAVETEPTGRAPSTTIRSPLTTPSEPFRPLASVSPISPAPSAAPPAPPPAPPPPPPPAPEPVPVAEAPEPPAPAVSDPPGAWSPTGAATEGPASSPFGAVEPPPTSAAAFGTPSADTFLPGGGRAAPTDMEEEDGLSLPPLRPFDARPSSPSVPPPPPTADGWPDPVHDEDPPSPSGSTSIEPAANAPTAVPQSSVLPPPISGDPWTTPFASKELNGDDGA